MIDFIWWHFGRKARIFDLSSMFFRPRGSAIIYANSCKMFDSVVLSDLYIVGTSQSHKGAGILATECKPG